MSSTRSPRAASPPPFPVQRLVIPDVLAGRDVLVQVAHRLGQDARLRRPDGRAPRGRRTAGPPRSCSSPTRELASQIVDELRRLAHARALSIAAVYGGVGIETPGRAARRAHILVATPGRLEDLIGRGAVTLDARAACSSSTRPTACSTWASARPSTGSCAPTPARPPDAVLLGHARRRGRAARRRATRTTPAATSSAAAPSARGDVEHRFVARRPRGQARRARARAAPRASAAARSCSCAPSAAPTGWSSACAATTSTAVAMHGDKSQAPAREGARAASSAATSTRWSRPTSPPAASTSTASRTSSTSTRPPTARTTSTASAAPAAPARTGIGITFVLPEQRAEVARIAHALALSSDVTGPAAGPRTPARRRPGSRRRRG